MQDGLLRQTGHRAAVRAGEVRVVAAMLVTLTAPAPKACRGRPGPRAPQAGLRGGRQVAVDGQRSWPSSPSASTRSTCNHRRDSGPARRAHHCRRSLRFDAQILSWKSASFGCTAAIRLTPADAVTDSRDNCLARAATSDVRDSNGHIRQVPSDSLMWEQQPGVRILVQSLCGTLVPASLFRSICPPGDGRGPPSRRNGHRAAGGTWICRRADDRPPGTSARRSVLGAGAIQESQATPFGAGNGVCFGTRGAKCPDRGWTGVSRGRNSVSG